MNISPKKVQQINGLTESTYVGVITAIFRHAPKLIERGGDWSLILVPVAAFINAMLYWNKTQQPGFNDSALKTTLNKLYYGGKVVAAAAGVGLAIAGMLTVGFSVLIVSGYVSVARSLGKAARSAWAGDTRKVANNLGKSLVGGLIAGGFTLMTFFPPLALAGATMVFMGTAAVFVGSAPSLIADVAVPLKEIAEPQGAKDSLSSNHVGSRLFRPSVSTEAAAEGVAVVRKRAVSL